ncbi:MAG: hypothetical protein ABJC62_02285 [Frankiaceae bacterium]
MDDFDGVLSRLHGAGAEWTEQADLFGGRRGFTRDPAGNRVELLERAGTLAETRPQPPAQDRQVP